jgi:hypothetical protein
MRRAGARGIEDSGGRKSCRFDKQSKSVTAKYPAAIPATSQSAVPSSRLQPSQPKPRSTPQRQMHDKLSRTTGCSHRFLPLLLNLFVISLPPKKKKKKRDCKPLQKDTCIRRRPAAYIRRISSAAIPVVIVNYYCYYTIHEETSHFIPLELAKMLQGINPSMR